MRRAQPKISVSKAYIMLLLSHQYHENNSHSSSLTHNSLLNSMHSILDLSIAALALAGSGFACTLRTSIKLTNYGYPDASGIPSYACQNGQPVEPGTSTKLGDGSFNNPYAAAAAVTSTTFQKCQKVYVPLLEKYFIIQDDCSGCRKYFSTSRRK